ncbi:MAG: universal stress protein [Azospirillaceae bacterium]
MFRDILLPIDLGDESSWRAALLKAIAQARAFGARLHLITVVPDFGLSIVGSFFPEGYEEAALATASERLHAFSAEHVPDDLTVQHIVAHGTVYEEILAAQRRIDADLILMGSHRPALRDYLLGPNAARVVRHAPCSVLVVRG